MIRKQFSAAAWIACLALSAFELWASPSLAREFEYHPPGKLLDDHGIGSTELSLFAPGIVFPIQSAYATTLNSQIRGWGSRARGVDQCDARNFDEVWWDTYCEWRQGKNRASLACKSREIHQGVDIRVGGGPNDRQFSVPTRKGRVNLVESCTRMRGLKRDVAKGRKRPSALNIIPVVAVADGVIDSIGPYSVALRSGPSVFKYLHMNMKALPIKRSELPKPVKAGDVIGYLLDDFGKWSTTFHLHFEHWQGGKPVPLYCDLVNAYGRATGKAPVRQGDGPDCASDADAPPSKQTEEAQEPDLTALVLAPQGPIGDGVRTRWWGGGRLMGLSAAGDGRRLQDEETGAVFFDGRLVANQYKGVVFAPVEGCIGVAPYNVIGPVLSNEEELSITLRGNRPVVGPETDCRIVGAKPVTHVITLRR